MKTFGQETYDMIIVKDNETLGSIYSNFCIDCSYTTFKQFLRWHNKKLAGTHFLTSNGKGYLQPYVIKQLVNQSRLSIPAKVYYSNSDAGLQVDDVITFDVILLSTQRMKYQRIEVESECLQPDWCRMHFSYLLEAIGKKWNIPVLLQPVEVENFYKRLKGEM